MIERSNESPASEHVGSVSLWLVHAHQKPSQEQMSANGTGGSRNKEAHSTPAEHLSAVRALGSPVAGNWSALSYGVQLQHQKAVCGSRPNCAAGTNKTKTHTGCLAQGRPVHDQASTQLSLASGFFFPTSGGGGEK